MCSNRPVSSSIAGLVAPKRTLDAEGMLRVLAAYLAGDPKACSMVRVPTPDEEDTNDRIANYLTRKRLRIENRIEAPVRR